MNCDPQKFFMGLMDFFSILLPGALLTFILMGDAGSVVLGGRASELVGAEGWAAFLFMSYLLGHLVFLLGSWLDAFYVWARRYTLNTQIAVLAHRDRLRPWRAHALIRLVYKGEHNLAVNRAVRIKQQALGSLGAAESINTFQWCKALLNAGRVCRWFRASKPTPGSSAVSRSCCCSLARRGPFNPYGHLLRVGRAVTQSSASASKQEPTSFNVVMLNNRSR